MHTPRSLIALLLLTTISVGLASRMPNLGWSDFFSQNAGDVLWATALYLALWFVVPMTGIVKLLLCTIVISFAVEFSQLLQWGWLIEARQTLPGKLLLGQGFVWMDLPRYVAGALLGAAMHGVLGRRFR